MLCDSCFTLDSMLLRPLCVDISRSGHCFNLTVHVTLFIQCPIGGHLETPDLCLYNSEGQKSLYIS